MRTLKDGSQLCLLSQTLLTGVSSFCLSALSAALQWAFAEGIFWAVELSLWWDREVPGLLRARSSFTRRREGTRSGREFAERASSGQSN